MNASAPPMAIVWTPDALRSRLAQAQSLHPDIAATDAVAVYLTAKSEGAAAAEPWDHAAAEAKALLNDIIAETGQTAYKTPVGDAYIPAPSTRVSYDAKALDALCASSPELARVLGPHRRETGVAGSLTIRAAKGGAL